MAGHNGEPAGIRVQRLPTAWPRIGAVAANGEPGTPHPAQPGDGAVGLLRAAGEALRMARERGGNCVAVVGDVNRGASGGAPAP